jgi:hypothetical protein
MKKVKNWLTVYDLCCDGSWEDKYYAFNVAGSKKQWEAVHYSPKVDKVIISRLTETGGKSTGILDMRYTFRYVPRTLLITHLYSR